MNENGPKIYLLPNLMTAGNLFCGFAAVLCIYDGSQESNYSVAAIKFHDAIWFILAACIFDLLDGRLARLGGRGSAFGREFDSLADIVSFGLAPAGTAAVLSTAPTPVMTEQPMRAARSSGIAGSMRIAHDSCTTVREAYVATWP